VASHRETCETPTIRWKPEKELHKDNARPQIGQEVITGRIQMLSPSIKEDNDQQLQIAETAHERNLTLPHKERRSQRTTKGRPPRRLLHNLEQQRSMTSITENVKPMGGADVGLTADIDNKIIIYEGIYSAVDSPQLKVYNTLRPMNHTKMMASPQPLGNTKFTYLRKLLRVVDIANQRQEGGLNRNL
jgi:hypothetical protein